MSIRDISDIFQYPFSLKNLYFLTTLLKHYLGGYIINKCSLLPLSWLVGVTALYDLF